MSPKPDLTGQQIPAVLDGLSALIGDTESLIRQFNQSLDLVCLPLLPGEVAANPKGVPSSPLAERLKEFKSRVAAINADLASLKARLEL